VKRGAQKEEASLVTLSLVGGIRAEHLLAVRKKKASESPGGNESFAAGDTSEKPQKVQRSMARREVLSKREARRGQRQKRRCVGPGVRKRGTHYMKKIRL